MVAETVQNEYYDITTVVTGPTETNCYIVYHHPSTETLIIDPGEDASKIIDIANAKRGIAGELRYILLTHAHHDQLGAAAALSDEFKIPCAFHKGDKRLFRMAAAHALEESGRKVRVPLSYRAFIKEPDFYFGGHQVSVIHTPGHTAGSVCYVIDNSIFTGDTLLHSQLGSTDATKANIEKMSQSIDKIFEKCPENKIIYPAHGAPWQLDPARNWWQENHILVAEIL